MVWVLTLDIGRNGIDPAGWSIMGNPVRGLGSPQTPGRGGTVVRST